MEHFVSTVSEAECEHAARAVPSCGWPTGAGSKSQQQVQYSTTPQRITEVMSCKFSCTVKVHDTLIDAESTATDVTGVGRHKTLHLNGQSVVIRCWCWVLCQTGKASSRFKNTAYLQDVKMANYGMIPRHGLYQRSPTMQLKPSPCT